MHLHLFQSTFYMYPVVSIVNSFSFVSMSVRCFIQEDIIEGSQTRGFYTYIHMNFI